MLFKVQKNTESLNPRVLKTSNGKKMILSKCTICGKEKTKLIKRQEASVVLRSVGIRTPLSKNPVLALSFFECNSVECKK